MDTQQDDATFYQLEYLSRYGWTGTTMTYAPREKALAAWERRRERDTGSKERMVGVREDGSRFILIHDKMVRLASGGSPQDSSVGGSRPSTR